MLEGKPQLAMRSDFQASNRASGSGAEEFCRRFPDYFSPSFKAHAGVQDFESIARAKFIPSSTQEVVNVLVGWRTVKNPEIRDSGIIDLCQLPAASPSLGWLSWIPCYVSQNPVFLPISFLVMNPENTSFHVPGPVVLFNSPSQNMSFGLGLCQIGIGRTSSLCQRGNNFVQLPIRRKFLASSTPLIFDPTYKRRRHHQRKTEQNNSSYSPRMLFACHGMIKLGEEREGQTPFRLA